MASERMKKQYKTGLGDKPPMTPFQEAIYEKLTAAKEKLDEHALLD